jgi:hypothetical protein
MRAGRRRLTPAAIAAAGAFVLVVVPSAALADGIIGGGIQQVTTTTTSTVTPTSDALGDALGDATTALPPIDQVVSDTTSTVTNTADDLLVGVGQTLGGSDGSEASAPSGASNDPSRPDPSEPDSTSAPAHPAASPSRSGRAISAAPWSGFAPPAAATSLGFSQFSPPPPRYGGEAGGTLATTGANVLLPLGVLILLTVLGLGTRTAEELRSRIRMYGALTYHGKHRMPRRRRPQLGVAAP